MATINSSVLEQDLRSCLAFYERKQVQFAGLMGTVYFGVIVSALLRTEDDVWTIALVLGFACVQVVYLMSNHLAREYEMLKMALHRRLDRLLHRLGALRVCEHIDALPVYDMPRIAWTLYGPLILGSLIVGAWSMASLPYKSSRSWGIHMLLVLALLWTVQYLQWKRQLYEELHESAWEILEAAENRSEFTIPKPPTLGLVVLLYRLTKLRKTNWLRRTLASISGQQPRPSHLFPVLVELGVFVQLTRACVERVREDARVMNTQLKSGQESEAIAQARRIRETLAGGRASKLGDPEAGMVRGRTLGYLLMCLGNIENRKDYSDVSDSAQRISETLENPFLVLEVEPEKVGRSRILTAIRSCFAQD